MQIYSHYKDTKQVNLSKIQVFLHGKVELCLEAPSFMKYSRTESSWCRIQSGTGHRYLKSGLSLNQTFTLQAWKVLLQCMHKQLCHNTISIGRGLLDGVRRIWHIQKAVRTISHEDNNWEKYLISLLFSKWSCKWWGCNLAMDGQISYYHDIYNPPFKW